MAGTVKSWAGVTFRIYETSIGLQDRFFPYVGTHQEEDWMPFLAPSRNRSSRSRSFRAGVVVCVILLALLSLMLIPHVHQTPSDAEHCALCITMHTAVSVKVAAVLVVLVRLGVSSPVFQAAECIRYWHPQLFIRPPPQNR